MDYSIGKERAMLQKSVREFFEKEYPKDKVRELKEDPRAYDAKVWKKMIKLGFQGLSIPETYGGMEGDLIEQALFMEEVGRHVVPMPYFSTIALGALPVMEFGTEAQKEKYLPGIAEGGDIWTLAQTEECANYEDIAIQLKAESDKEGYRLSGTKLYVPYAHIADMMLVAARTSKSEDPRHGITLFLVNPESNGILIETMPTEAKDGRCEVVFENVLVNGNQILGSVDQGWQILDDIQQKGSLMKAAEMLGGACAAFELALDYTKNRKQFDELIGSYQAVQFKLVEMLTQLDGLKYLVYNAAWAIAEGEPSRMLVSAAKAKANEVYHLVCHHGMYLQGAIGWTEEMDIGLYHLRTISMTNDCGTTDLHLENVACELENENPPCATLWS